MKKLFLGFLIGFFSLTLSINSAFSSSIPESQDPIKIVINDYINLLDLYGGQVTKST